MELPHDEKVQFPKAADQAVELLWKYLTAQRVRSVEQELRARRTLGIILLQQKKMEEAKTALATQHLKQPLPTAAARRYYADIQRILGRLNAVAEDVKADNVKENQQ